MSMQNAAYFQGFKGPETFLVTSLSRPGELGNSFERAGSKWQLVKCTSTCSAKDLLFWSDRMRLKFLPRM